MDPNKKKKMLKAYRSFDIATLQDLKTKAEEFLTSPGEAKPEEIQEAKNILEVVTELLEVGESGGLDMNAIIAERDRLIKDNARLTSKLAEYEGADATRAAEEKQIAEKVSAGLTRDQAIKVIQRQKDHDRAIAAQWEKRRPAIVAILNEKLTEREMRTRVREIDAAITLDEINAAKATLTK